MPPRGTTSAEDDRPPCSNGELEGGKWTTCKEEDESIAPSKGLQGDVSPLDPAVFPDRDTSQRLDNGACPT